MDEFAALRMKGGACYYAATHSKQSEINRYDENGSDVFQVSQAREAGRGKALPVSPSVRLAIR